MKAVAVHPGEPNSMHLRDVPRPSVSDIPDGRGVLVRVLQVGVDATDREVNDAEYGKSPGEDDYLILGHESLGIVEEVGPGVDELEPGDYVAAIVRRPGESVYDTIGLYDMTTDDEYFERGINRLHGYLTEYYVEHEQFVVRVPTGCSDIGVLTEPMSIVEKAIHQTYEIQRRMKIWRPKRAAVMGTGTLGLLAVLALRLRGIQVTAFGLEKMPFINGRLVEDIGGRYFSVKEKSLGEAKAGSGPYDIIFEATGNSAVAFESAEHLGKNGVLILASITGGDRMTEIPSDKINLDFVLGNKVMFGTVNANREHFEMATRDLSQSVTQFPGWLEGLLTHPVDGLHHYEEMLHLLKTADDAIKVYVNVAKE